MSFLRSLFSGVSALRNQQTMMDVIGNNIANINTVGFKSGRVTFSELYAQTLRGATRPTDTTGGTNAMQVGLGMSVSSLDTMFTQGNIETTGNPYDMAVYGSGFFVVSKDGQQYYTRDGSFHTDADGRLVNGNGAILQGKMADATGAIPEGTSLENLVINNDLTSPAKATTKVTYAGNLDSSAATYDATAGTGGLAKTTMPIFDSLGNSIELTVQFTKTGDNAWDWQASIPGATTGTTVSVGSGSLSFSGSDGTVQTGSPATISFTPTGGADPLNITLDFGTAGKFSGITTGAQSSGSSVVARSQDGYQSGVLKDVSVESTGMIVGTFSNNVVQNLGQIMLADFTNPSGLEISGGNAYAVSGNSGTAAIVTAGQASTIYSGSLEQSNVDLSDEFTKMITAQRGFQASARVITTSDEFLQEVVNLKR